MQTKNKGIGVSNQLQLETSFVPEILKKQFSENPKWNVGDEITDNHAALLWVDIFSFSPLCNRLMKDTLSGVEKLTEILNSHYDLILNVILENGGQPLFFVGDGLISIWPGDKNEASDLIARAISCANEILDKRETVDDHNRLLSLHTVVTFGTWQIVELDGIQDKKLLSYFGDVFNDLAIASKNRAPNQILIYNSALSYLSKNLKREAVKHNTSIILDTIEKPAKVKKQIFKLTEEGIQKLKKFTPSTLTFPLSKERLEWMAEIRPVSIIFIKFPDIRKVSSRKLHQMAEVSKLATPLVIKYEGLLYQIWMDDKATNMLICFGPYPTAHDDNPERSVKLAYEISALLKENHYENSIGISTGMAYCGILGNDVLRQHTVIGDVVNQSARISGISLSDILCDQTTYNASKKSVNYGTPVEVEIKGRSELVKLYPIENITKQGAQENEHRVSIGREDELNRLFETCQRANGKNNTIVIIEGDNGMGKSKLLRDFNYKALSVDYNVVTTAGDFLARKTPYNVLGTIFTTLLGLKSVELGVSSKEILDSISEKYGTKACLLNVVLNTDFPDSDELKSFTASQRVAATHDLLLNILEEETNKSLLVIQIDDAQWMDETCWGLVESINSSLKNCTIIMSFLKTKGIDHINVDNLKNYEQLTIDKLSKEDLKKLICSEFKVSNVSNEVLTLTEKIAKGNPFFSLEFIGSLEDQQLITLDNNECCLIKDAIINELSLPETVRGALRRRLDRLDHGSQLSLKVGSVVGNRFSREIISEIYPIETERAAVASYLDEAKHSGFLIDTRVDNNEGYRFNNATTAEVAYEMTLAEQRRHLHRESAEWYEQNFKENLQPFYVRLAHHWIEAGDKSKALAYHEKESIRLHSLGFVKQGLEVGLEAIKLLNFTIEREPETIGPKIQEHMGAIAGLMADKSIENLIDHKKLENEETEQLIKMLLFLSPLAHQCHRPELFAVMPIVCLRLTLEQGNGASAAEVYSMYSIIHKALTGDSHAAFSWSTLAMAVDDKNKNKHLASVGFIHGWFIAHWLQPIKELIPLSHVSADAGFVTGDILFACFNLSLSVILKAVSGQPLEDVVSTVNSNLKRNNQSVITAVFHLIHEKQVAKALQGKTDGYVSLSDSSVDEAKDIASVCDTDMHNQIGYYFISKIKLHVHYGNWEEAIPWGEKASQLLMAFSNQPGHFEFEQFYTMAALYRAAETEGETAEGLNILANEGIEKINSWAEHCPSNFLAKALIVQAIKKGIDGEVKDSEQLFKQAAAEAQKHGFMQDCGLAYEHLMRLQKKQGLDYLPALKLANNAYETWGAQAKINYLKEEFQI